MTKMLEYAGPGSVPHGAMPWWVEVLILVVVVQVAGAMVVGAVLWVLARDFQLLLG